MKFLQKLGKSLMIPVACLPVCGILMGVGYLLCPAGMQGGEIIGFWAKLGFFLCSAGGAVINHMAVLFALGVGIGMSDGEGNGALAALVSWLMILTLLSKDTVSTILPRIAEDGTAMLALSKIENPFIGILAGQIGAYCILRFKDKRLPSWLSFFSGKRLGIIMAGLVSIAVSAILLILWPLLFTALVFLGEKIAELGYFGSALYATMNRLLIPFGLHHALNNVFWFDTIGIGDLTLFWAGKTTAEAGHELGIYMSGFFPCMMFGVSGAALAMRRSFRREDRRTAGLLASAAVSALLCGVTEPFEFLFMFVSPGLYVVYSVLYGVFTYITNIVGFRAGFSFSGGLIDLIFSASLPAAQKTLLILPLGAGAFAAFYIVFRLLITGFDLKTPGREEVSDAAAGSVPLAGPAGLSKEAARAAGIIRGLGGKENIMSVSHCATRLRLEVKDNSLCREDIIKGAGAAGVMKLGKNGVQVVIGMDVEFTAEEMLRQLSEAAPAAQDPCVSVPKASETAEEIPAADTMDGQGAYEEICAPADGRIVPMEEIPDETFADGVLGRCFGVIPENGSIYAPCSGTVVMVAETLHAVGICSEGGRDVLVHVGINTVSLKGKGFVCHVKAGDAVAKGDLLLTADLALIRQAGLDPMVITAVQSDDPCRAILTDM